MSSTFKVHYWLATSAVQLAGTKKETTPDHGKPHTVYDGAATLLTRADMRSGRVTFDVERSNLQETKVTLSLTPDGRLTSSNVETTGSGATILAAVASIAGTVASLAPMLPLKAGPEGGAKGVAEGGSEGVTEGGSKGVHEGGSDGAAHSDTWDKDDLLKSLAEDEDKLALALDAVVIELAAGGERAIAAAKQLDGIDKALTMIAGQRDRLTKEKLVWVGGTDTTTSYTYILDARDLPTEQEFKDGKLDGTAQEVWDNLHLMATVDDIGVPSKGDGNGNDPFQDGADSSIWYREPRRVKVQVWKRGQRRPLSEQEVDWIDVRCTHRSVSLQKDGWMAHNTASASFGDNGALSSVGLDFVPGLPSVATALAGLPKEFSTGYSDMSGVQSAWGTDHPSADQIEIAALTDKDKRLSLLADIAKLQQGASNKSG